MLNSNNPTAIGERLARLEAEIISKNTFSTSEIDTGKIWTDGSPIYRQTFTMTAPESIVDGTYSSSSSSAITNADKIISLNGIASTGNTSFSLPFISSGGYFIKLHFSDTNKKVYLNANGNSFSTVPVIVTIEYTKSTS